MNFDVKTIRDLVHKIMNMPDVENSFGAVVSPDLIIHDGDGNEFVINDLYLRGDDKAVLILSKETK